jgi:hypothetical protein
MNMPIKWTINHDRRLVIAVCGDTVSRTDIEDYLDKVVVGDALPYAKLFDIADATLALDGDDMMALGARIRAYAGISDLGPLALVAASPEGHDKARQFAVLAGANRPIRIFSKLSSAERWLAAAAGDDDRPVGPRPRLRSLLLAL